MRRTTSAVLAAGVLVLAGCGSEAPDDEAAGSPRPSSSATTPPLAGGEGQRLQYASPEALAKHTPVVVLGTVASWEEGPTVVLAERGGGEDRIPYALLVVDVDQVVKDTGGLVTGDQIAVPVRLDDATDFPEVAPTGSNVAFLGGADTSFGVFGDVDVEIEPGGSVDLDSVLWGESQGVLLETSTGQVVNADPFARADIWPEIGELPDEEQFGMLAQRLMALG